MSGIVISYRRETHKDFARHLHDYLGSRFGRDKVFLDSVSIPPGNNYPRAIQNAIKSSDFVLVVIGKAWLEATDQKGTRRLDYPSDWVRREIRTALKEPGVTVMPILVDGAQMPDEGELPQDIRDLAVQQAFRVADNFDSDVEALIRILRRRLPPSPAPRPSPPIRPTQPEPSWLGIEPWMFIAPLVILIIVGIVFAAMWLDDPPGGGSSGDGFPGSKAGTMSLTPSQGTYEQEIVVSGSGWPANDELEVTAQGLATKRVTTAGDGSFRISLSLDPQFKPVAFSPVTVKVNRVNNVFDSKTALYTFR